MPLFLIPLVFGALELGRVMWVRSQLMNAAREGGTYAQTSPLRVADTGTDECKTPYNIEARARAGLRQGSSLLAVQANSVTVQVDKMTAGGGVQKLDGCFKSGLNAVSGDRIRVTVNGVVAPYTLLGILPVGGYSISGTQEVRVQ